MPEIIHPMLATLVDEPFSDPEWIFETKWDGFRSVCFVSKGKARFVSRNQIEMTPQYPELANIPKQIDAKEAILDGEIVALDEHGRPQFQLLQNKLRIQEWQLCESADRAACLFRVRPAAPRWLRPDGLPCR